MVNTTDNSGPLPDHQPSPDGTDTRDHQRSAELDFPDLAELPDGNTRIEREAQVPDTLTGQRFDQIAAQLFPEFSRGKLQSWIQSGELTADEQQCKPRQKLVASTRLTLSAEYTPVSEWVAEDRPINIVFEDEHVLVVDKPSNCVVHPAAGIHSGTLVNSVLAHCPENAALPRGGIVHRLDKDTSGLLVVAKSLQAHASLVRQLQERSVSRIYRAIVRGTFVSGGTVDAPIGRHPSARTKMAVVKAGSGKPAVTHYRIQQRFTHHTDLSIQLETGRTHQIRVHMAHINHPLVGDKTYNARYKRVGGINAELNTVLMDFPRQALHAHELRFDHPLSGERCEFQSALPQDYQQLIQALTDHDNDSAE